MSKSEPRRRLAAREMRMPHDALWLSESGLKAGHILLVDHLAPEQGRARLDVMLAVAFRKRLPRSVIKSIDQAVEASRNGDQAHANLRIALLGLSRIPDANAWPTRRAMVEDILSSGMTGSELLSCLEQDLAAGDSLTKSDTEQPRVPAGSGRESGRWTSGSAEHEQQTSSAVPAVVAIASRGAPLFSSAVGAETLAALSTVAASVGFAATLGVLFVPSPNSTSGSGPLPGDTENTYSYDRDEGLLRVLGASGVVLAAGHRDSSGVFTDVDTGVPFAREVDGALLFDSDSVETVTDHTEPATAVRPQEEEEEDDEEKQPKLCPDPGLDNPGAFSASARAKAYQEQISFMINPQRPLPFGLAMNLINPLTLSIVHYDECDEMTGTMVEAKGPGFAGLLSFPSGEASLRIDWARQGRSELQAAGLRQVVWYFGEDSAAAYARALFASSGLGKIVVRVQHPW